MKKYLFTLLTLLMVNVQWSMVSAQTFVVVDKQGNKTTYDVSKLDIEGTAFSIAGRGRAWTEDRTIDLTLDVHLLNRGTWLGAGVYWLTTPFSKIFAIRASGTVDDPQWSSARLSSGKK